MKHAEDAETVLEIPARYYIERDDWGWDLPSVYYFRLPDAAPAQYAGHVLRVQTWFRSRADVYSTSYRYTFCKIGPESPQGRVEWTDIDVAEVAKLYRDEGNAMERLDIARLRGRCANLADTLAALAEHLEGISLDDDDRTREAVKVVTRAAKQACESLKEIDSGFERMVGRVEP